MKRGSRHSLRTKRKISAALKHPAMKMALGTWQAPNRAGDGTRSATTLPPGGTGYARIRATHHNVKRKPKNMSVIVDKFVR
jgi:hypothetical protein